MPRIAHGEVATPQQLQEAERDLASHAASIDLSFAVAAPAALEDFDFLFLKLQGDAANLLPKSATTVKRLKELGATMQDPGVGGDPGDANIPALYTYFGQFVDHDITFEASSFTLQQLLAANMTPLALDKIRNELKNLRTAGLELDSLYGPPAPRDPANRNKMGIGRVSKAPGTVRPPGKGDDNDLPREPRSSDIRHDRAALIGDPRNDENLIVAQLHLAFLKAHNQLVAQGRTFEEARRLAVRNLLRGYGLRMPTGQAAHLGLPVLTASQLEAAASSPEQAEVLRGAGFLDRTPLWYYLLAEVKHHGGQRLGPVGSTIVAEVLIGLVRRSDDSILTSPGWVPSLPAAQSGRFELADLLRFAKVVGGGPRPRTYKVKRGDTLSKIAERELGSADRWPEIYRINRDVLSDPDRISSGQVLVILPS